MYLLGKLLIKHALDLKYGLIILDDCIEVMKIIGANENVKFYKANYWIAKALSLSNYKEYSLIKSFRESRIVIKEIIGYLKSNVKKLVEPANEMMK